MHYYHHTPFSRTVVVVCSMVCVVCCFWLLAGIASDLKSTYAVPQVDNHRSTPAVTRQQAPVMTATAVWSNTDAAEDYYSDYRR